MKKRLLATVLALCMALTLLPATASAANDDKELACANALNELGLFMGVGTLEDGTPDYNLGGLPSRVEALVMLLRVLGLEDEALSLNLACHFTDVPDWAKPYVSYAYEKGLTKGISAALFGASDKAEAYTYLTFILRALGYSDAGGADFSWDEPFALAERTGILQYGVNVERFTRGDVAEVTYYALSAKHKDSGHTLLHTLVSAGAVEPDAAGKLETQLGAHIDPVADDFLRTQDDNFINGGMAAWDGQNYYFLVRLPRVNGLYRFKLLRSDAALGGFETLYETSGTRLSRLSFHDGKLYFIEDTSLAGDVASPRYSLMECDPATGEVREVWGETHFSDYYWYDGVFYIMSGVNPFASYSERRSTLRSVSPEGRPLGTLMTGLDFSQSASFQAYGWKGRLFYHNASDNEGESGLWSCDLSGGDRKLLIERAYCESFEGGYVYYIISGVDTLWRSPLDAPEQAEKVTELPEDAYGDVFIESGVLYFYNHNDKRLYSYSEERGLTAFTSGASVYSSFTFFSHYIIMPMGGILDSAPEDVYVFDMETGEKTGSLSFFGEAR